MRHFLAIFVCTVAGLHAQTITSSLIGTIHDDSGAVVPGATVSALNVATNARASAKTDANGDYLLLQLTPGTYTVDVEAAGFKKYVQSGVTLQLQQQAKLDVSLAVGQLTETVTVQADASQLETTRSTVGDVVNNRAILNLPLNTRNVFSLIYLTPGVSGGIGNDYNSLSYSVNGARGTSSEAMVDGATGGFPTVNGFFGIGVFPSVDALSEFKMMDSNYSAEFGRSLGNVINLIYKNGTNAFHGSAYEFLRNSALDANTFFSNARAVPLGSLKRSQYGGVFNGPIRRNKTFFLFSLEDLRQRAFQSTTTTVPTLLQRGGDFSQTFASNGQQIRIFDPFSTRANPAGGYIRDQFPGNVIPAARINPVAANLIKYFPQSTIAGTQPTNANNYYNTGSHINDINSWDVRIDHNLNDRQRIFGRYSDRFNNDLPANLFPKDITIAEGVINQKNYMRNAVVDYTYTLNPTTIVSGRLGFSRALYYYLNEGLGFLASSLGLPKTLDTAGYLPIFPQVTTSGYTTLGNQDNRRNAFMTYSALASVTKIKGPHTIKVGWEGRMIRVNNHEYRDTSGNYGFSAGFSQGPNPSAASSTAGSGLASLLLGTGSGDLIQNFKDVASQSFYHGLYVQDDWRVSRKLTLNLGVRYDLDTPRTDRYNRINFLDPFIPSPLAGKAPGLENLRGGLVFVGINGRNRYQYDWDNNNLAPRIGFAYQLNGKTVIRGGWGNVFAASPQAAQGTVGPYGFRVQSSWVGTLDGITPYDTLSNPFPQGFRTPPGSADGLLTGAGGLIQGDLRNTITPYTMQWNLNVQRTLPGQLTLETGYVGNRGLQLQRNSESGLDFDQINPAYLSLGSHLNDLVANPFYGLVNTGVLAAPQVSRAQLLRPYPQFTSVIPLFSSGSSSTYHSLQVRFNKRYAHGMQFEGSYVWSKVVDNGASHQDSYNILPDRAVTSYDITHRFVVGYIYELPFGRGRHFGSHAPGAVNWVLGGWQFNGITTLQSGAPLAMSASNTSGLGNPTERANNNGHSAALSGDVHTRLNRYFDTSVFSQPAPFTLGNVAAYLSDLRAPYANNFDLSLFKEFFPREYLRIQFRAEFLNAFNRVQFSGPNTSVTNASFGVISSQANSPRQIQFGLKILF